jgi:hypothetical protein
MELVSHGGPIAYRDAEGKVQSYRTLDEAPPEVRDLIASMRRGVDPPPR